MERVKHARCDGFVQEPTGCIEVLLFPDHCLRCSLPKLAMTWSGRVDVFEWGVQSRERYLGS